MEIEDALLIIEKHRGDLKTILRKIKDRDILKQLMRTESFLDMVIEYFYKNPGGPDSDSLMEILQEISEEEAEKYPHINEEISDLKETARIYRKARDKYLLLFLKDPLASLLIRKLRLTPVKSAVLGFALTFLTYMTGYILYFLLHQPIAGITMTGLDPLFDFILIPLVFGYYVWISSKGGYLFLDLKRRGIKLDGENKFDRFAYASVNNLINHRFWSIASATVAACLIAVTVFSAATYQTIWGPRESNFILFSLWKVPILWGFSWYMVFVTFIKETAIIISLRRLLRKENLSLNASHEDRQGGMKPVSDYAMKFTYFIMACGFGFVLLFIRSWKYEYLREDMLVDIGLLIYMGLACFFFFFLLSPAHRLIKRLDRKSAGREILPATLSLLPPLRPAVVLEFASLTSLPIIILLVAPVVRSGLNL